MSKLQISNAQQSDCQIWQKLRQEAVQAIENDSIMASFLDFFIIEQKNLQEALAWCLIERLNLNLIDKTVIFHIFTDILENFVENKQYVQADLKTVYERDPATHKILDVLLYYKGFLALQTHRIAHTLWQQRRYDLAYYLQSHSSSAFQTDIHPAAQIGKGVFIDHATSLVIGETVKIADNVSLLHEVTLGGTGKIEGDRHPKIAEGVLVGAGAKVLGNIHIGKCSQIAANSVVLKDVPAHVTVAGVPAKIIGKAKAKNPASNMDQTFFYGNGDGI